MAEHKGDLYLEIGGKFNLIDKDGKEYTETLIGDKSYWVDSVINYKDGYSDIIFFEGTKLPQVRVSELGYITGKPDVTNLDEIVE